MREHMNLVYETVGRILPRLPPNVLRDDLIAAGTYGLTLALKDGERGPAFERYARMRIRGAILDELRSQDFLSRRARARFTKENGEARARIDLEDLPISLERASDPTPDESLEHAQDRDELARAIEALPERERMIVSMHYFKDVQLKDIASELGVSTPRVSQLHARAMKMLRDQLS